MNREQRLRKDAQEILSAALQAVDAGNAVRRHVQRTGDRLRIGSREFDLNAFKHVWVVGAGKASAAMAMAVEEILGDKITGGLVNVKYGHVADVKHVQLQEAGHPVPDDAGVQGAHQIMQLLEKAGDDDLVICLLSGGGSALLPAPVEGVTLADKQKLTQRLLACGATIAEINAVRKHISGIKGGQLARIANPATVVTLVLSDVIGDPLDAIASGPTVPDSTTFSDVADILHRYRLWHGLPAAVKTHLQDGLAGKVAETPKAGDDVFDKTLTHIVANNRQAIAAAQEKATALGYHALILSSYVEGESREVAKVFAAIAREIRQTGHPVQAPACVIAGGETTVTLRGSGKGGRNQEFVLAAVPGIDGLRDVVLLSAGTDGNDGPTDAAGAMADGNTAARARDLGLRVHEFLAANNSYVFFDRLNDLLITGPTNTNVMDLMVVLLG